MNQAPETKHYFQSNEEQISEEFIYRMSPSGEYYNKNEDEWQTIKIGVWLAIRTTSNSLTVACQ